LFECTAAKGALHQRDRAASGRHAPSLVTPCVQRGIYHVRRDQLAQLVPRGPVSLASALDRAAAGALSTRAPGGTSSAPDLLAAATMAKLASVTSVPSPDSPRDRNEGQDLHGGLR
jgi:hypothetical protein